MFRNGEIFKNICICKGIRSKHISRYFHKILKFFLIEQTFFSFIKTYVLDHFLHLLICISENQNLFFSQKSAKYRVLPYWGGGSNNVFFTPSFKTIEYHNSTYLLQGVYNVRVRIPAAIVQNPRALQTELAGQVKGKFFFSADGHDFPPPLYLWPLIFLKVDKNDEKNYSKY